MEKGLYEEPVVQVVIQDEEEDAPQKPLEPEPQESEPQEAEQPKKQLPETFKGKVIQCGLFFKLDTLDKSRVNFVKNHLHNKILPDDTILYRIDHGGDVRAIKIIHRAPFHTIGIISGHDPERDLYHFHCPLLTKNFVTSIEGKHLASHPTNITAIGTRYILEIKRDHTRITKCYGSIDNRAKDSLIMGALYTQSFQPVRKSYDLSIAKTEMPVYRYPPGYDPSKGPVNLSHLNSFNIDPPQSRDFDDALSVDLTTKRIYIHIVNGNQLEPNSVIEKTMMYQGMTLYTPIEIFNILPRSLAEDKMSLIKGKPRQVITFEFSINTDIPPSGGKLPINPDYYIYPSTIVIKNRYDYDNAMTSTDPVFTYLKNLTEHYYSRKTNVSQARYNYSHELGQEGKLLSIEYEEDTWTHRLIEMLMINTNRLVTEHFKSIYADEEKNKIPQRVHKEPLGQVSENITGDPIIDGIISIQHYKKATYTQHAEGHFGLGLERYTHVTSPIRRATDMIVMRMLEGYRYGDLDALLTHINQREKLNSTYEKQIRRWAMMGYLQERMETIYDAYIINHNPKGIKIFIKELGIDIFVLTKLKKDIGEKVRAKCKQVSYISHDDILFEIVAE